MHPVAALLVTLAAQAPPDSGPGTVPAVGPRTVTLYPQVWMRLSRLGHVAASLGAALPTVGPAPHRPRLISFLLWDFGDASLFRGW